MMTIITDSREQSPLNFSCAKGIDFKVDCLPVGDYTATYTVSGNESRSDTVFERKSKADLWGSFSGKNYERERDKMKRYQSCGFEKYILAVETTAFDIRQGHSYWKDGEKHESHKDGLSLFRQLMTCMRKYGIWIWFCNGKWEMAFMIQEYFLAEQKRKEESRNV